MNSTIKATSRVSLVFSAAMLLASVAGVPAAFADADVRTETVKFQDLNIDTPAGVQALYGRIHAAAKRVCAQTDPVLQPAANGCARKAEADAVQKLSFPQLTAYYRMKTGDKTQPLSASR